MRCCLDYYVKAVNNAPVLVSTLDKATLFKVGEAEKYIKNRIRKNMCSEYKIVQTNIPEVSSKISDIPKPEFQKSSVTSVLKEISESVHKKLSEQQNMYKDKIQYYDDVILDIRHYIRDENTRLNACQAANVLYRLQCIERKRAEVKLELQRIYKVYNSIDNAIGVADDFSYVPYKPRVIENMDEFLKKDAILLDAAIEIADWININDPYLPDNIGTLNYLQAIKRKRPLEKEERQQLRMLVESEQEYESTCVGAYLLLDDLEAAQVHYECMDKKKQESFRNFPIYSFFKQDDLSVEIERK